jgi:hypothetical protein
MMGQAMAGAMIEVRRLESQDVDDASTILYEAFASVYRRRGHTPPFPNVESAVWLCRAYLDLDPEGCALAVMNGAAVGVGFAHVRGSVTSIGPLAARPGARDGVGRAIMAHFHGLAAATTSVRLFQDAFNPDSFGLYTRLGYRVVDVAPYLVAARVTPPPSRASGLRPLVASDVPLVARYDLGRMGADRSRDLSLLAATGRGFVAERGGALAGYIFYRILPARVIVGPAMAESAELLADLVDAVADSVPERPAVIRSSAAAPSVVERAFERGFRVDHLGNLMVTGPYAPPPAQLYALFPESL